MAVYAQYENYKSLNKVMSGLDELFKIDIDEWFNNYFNIDTAIGDGLDNWGRILNRSRTIEVPLSSSIFFGLYGSTSGSYKPKNFNRGVFYKKRDTQYLDLSDDAYRHLLKFIWIGQNITPSIWNISKAINYYYSTQPNNTQQVIVSESDMRVIYTFVKPLQSYEKQIYLIDGVLPRPMGCGITRNYS